MAYTGHSHYSPSEPPTFVVVGERDGIASPSMMSRRVEALRKIGADVEFQPKMGDRFGDLLVRQANIDSAMARMRKAVRTYGSA